MTLQTLPTNAALLGTLAGLALAAGTIFLTRRLAPERALRIYAIGLVVAAFVYLVFALAGRASGQWLAIEGAGVAVYALAAWLGLRSPAVLALGWATHVLWDLALHLSGSGGAFTPDWYPWLCLGYDLAIAGDVMARARERGFPERQQSEARPGASRRC